MAKLILELEDGTKRVIRDYVDSRLTAHDVLVSDEYISAKIFTMDDFAPYCIPPTKTFQTFAKNHRNALFLEDCNDYDWALIFEIADEYQPDMKDIEDVAYYNEPVAEYVLSCNPYVMYHAIATPGSDDIAAMLEETLHRIIALTPEEKQEAAVEAIMGARKICHQEDYEEDDCIYLDLDYVLPGTILSWRNESIS